MTVWTLRRNTIIINLPLSPVSLLLISSITCQISGVLNHQLPLTLDAAAGLESARSGTRADHFVKVVSKLMFEAAVAVSGMLQLSVTNAMA